MTPSQEKRYAAASRILSALLISGDKSPDDKELATITRRAVRVANRLEKLIVRLEDPTPQKEVKAVNVRERLAAIQAISDNADSEREAAANFKRFTQES